MAPLILILVSVMSLHPAARRDDSARKTWTNDDIGSLRADAPISIFNPPAVVQAAVIQPVSGVPAGADSIYIKELDPDWYANEIRKIQAQIEASNAEIRRIQEIRKTGVGISGVIPLDREDVGLSPEATIAILQAQNQTLKAEVDNLQEMASRLDIPPGEIR
jgi:hypothetical protein